MPVEKMPLDPKKIYKLASAFQQMVEESLSLQKEISAVNVPFIANLCFAAELYLKCLHALDGSEKTGHNLSTLYESLKAETKALVEKNLPKHDIDSMGLTIEAALKEYRSGFVDFRYLFEGGKEPLNIYGIRTICSTLKEVCEIQIDRAET